MRRSTLGRTWGLLLVLSCAAPTEALRVYRVQAGDSLYSLAKQSGTTVQALQQRNGLRSTALRAGQVIELPEGSGPGVFATATPPSGEPPTAPASPPSIPPSTAQVPEIFQSGLAVYYSGRSDARTVLTAAHLSLPFGTWVEVRHARTGRTVLVLINDRGPFGRPERVIDLSAEAARVLGITDEGIAPVTLRVARRP